VIVRPGALAVPGRGGSVIVFTARGYPIRPLARNEAVLVLARAAVGPWYIVCARNTIGFVHRNAMEGS
jgi:hypothetical protein